jgi:NAD(P)H-dependent flavin oxidoreductase YrpB (nitropropane dioxygenase family)
MLMRKATGRIDGFIIEDFTAGGHNARPRGPMQLNERGEPIFGPRDVADLAVFRKLDIPFWLAGTRTHPDRVREAIEAGAQGVQIGTAFAFCDESAMTPEIKKRVRDCIARGEDEVITDPLASPAGLPFKIVQIAGTMSDEAACASRQRVCDLGYFRHAYRKSDGSIGWRCPAEPLDDYVYKGGDAADTAHRKCICNGLITAIGLGQVRNGKGSELPLVTAGLGTSDLRRYIGPDGEGYHAEDVIDDLLTGVPASAQSQ